MEIKQPINRMTIMNTFTKAITIISLSLSTLGIANAGNKFVAADDYVTTKLCTVAVQGSRIQLHKVIKESRLSKRIIVEKVTCNDQNILAFVSENAESPNIINSILTGGKVNSSVKITDLAAVEY